MCRVCRVCRGFVVLWAMRAMSAGRLYHRLDNVSVRVRHVLVCSARRHGPHRPAPEAQGQGRVAEEEMAALEGGAFLLRIVQHKTPQEKSFW